MSAKAPIYAHSPCNLCPRRCLAMRRDGRLGWCGAGAMPRVFRYGPHFGEEPPLSGTRGSGTLFFSHCTLKCIYCQNHPWSQGGRGENIDTDTLSARMRQMAEAGCHNWNLVSPTPWLPWIRDAAMPLINAGVRLPFVYNTSGFESQEILAAYADLIDIALIDLRYASDATATYASACHGYTAVARAAVKWLWQQLGPLQTDSNGIATRGVICRLLVLPGHAGEAVANLEWLAGEIGTDAHISVMSQYTPLHLALNRPDWGRKVSAAEYAVVTGAVERLGFENGWMQEHGAAMPADLLGCEMPAGNGAVGCSQTV